MMHVEQSVIDLNGKYSLIYFLSCQCLNCILVVKILRVRYYKRLLELLENEGRRNMFKIEYNKIEKNKL